MGDACAEFLLFIAVVAQFSCGTASLTSASWDDVRVLPRPRRARLALWRKVARNRVPVNAVIAIGSWRG
jgi:hypothetical protein